MDSSRISFVIPCKNGSAVLGQCLEALQGLRQPGDEIIVADNGSADNSVEVALSFEGVTVVSSDATTVSGVRNDGARTAGGDWLAFVDCDTVLGPNWRNSLYEGFLDGRVMATGSGPHLPVNSTWVERAWLCGWGRESGPVDYVWSGNLIVRQHAYQAMGGFDESLETDEDTDFCWRLREKFGQKSLVGAEDMHAVHLGNSKTSRQYWRRQYWHAAGILDSARKHGPDRALVMTIAFAVLHFVGATFFLLYPDFFGLTICLFSVLSIPFLTAFYRIRATECMRWFPHLVVLYTMFYYARTMRVALALLQRRLPKQ